MKRLSLLLVFGAAGLSSAAGQTIDLAKVYGDRNGCINHNGQEVVVDKMLLLKEGNLVMAYSACDIKKTTKNKEGSVTLQTHCDAEGEESDAEFRIVANKKKKGSFVVFDADNNLLGDVALCRK